MYYRTKLNVMLIQFLQLWEILLCTCMRYILVISEGGVNASSIQLLMTIAGYVVYMSVKVSPGSSIPMPLVGHIPARACPVRSIAN